MSTLSEHSPRDDGNWGKLFTLSAPSGTGKTTIANRLRAVGLVSVSISHTTRTPRPGEKSGEAYFFVSKEEFFQMREEDAFLEWAEVYGNFYGTSRIWVEKHLARGENVLLEIDCQGARRIREMDIPKVMIFLRPPDIATLRERLTKRNDVDDDAMQRRLQEAEQEMAQQEHFDHIVINDDLEQAVEDVIALIHPYCLLPPQQPPTA